MTVFANLFSKIMKFLYFCFVGHFFSRNGLGLRIFSGFCLLRVKIFQQSKILFYIDNKELLLKITSIFIKLHSFFAQIRLQMVSIMILNISKTEKPIKRPRVPPTEAIKYFQSNTNTSWLINFLFVGNCQKIFRRVLSLISSLF